MTVHNRVYHMKQKKESGSCFGLPVNGNWVTVHRQCHLLKEENRIFSSSSTKGH